MKIGKSHKRWGKPSQKFLDKKNAEAIVAENNRVVVGVDLAEETGDEASQTEATFAEIKIFLDDERPCPEGWTLARTPFEFFRLLRSDDEFLNRVTRLSLDWYLGTNQVDGVEIAKKLAYYFEKASYDDKSYLPSLKSINFHSSDREKASYMSDILREVLSLPEINRMDKLRFRRGLPL